MKSVFLVDVIRRAVSLAHFEHHRIGPRFFQKLKTCSRKFIAKPLPCWSGSTAIERIRASEVSSAFCLLLSNAHYPTEAPDRTQGRTRTFLKTTVPPI